MIEAHGTLTRKGQVTVPVAIFAVPSGSSRATKWLLPWKTAACGWSVCKASPNALLAPSATIYRPSPPARNGQRLSGA